MEDMQVLSDEEKVKIGRIVLQENFMTTDSHHSLFDEKGQAIYQYGLVHGPNRHLEFIFQTKDPAEFKAKAAEADALIRMLQQAPGAAWTWVEGGRQIKILDVFHCARCGSDHLGAVFIKFVTPIEDNDGTFWEWWARCPLNGDPILMKEARDKDE